MDNPPPHPQLTDTEKCHIKCSTFKATWLIMRDHFILIVCAQSLGRIRLFASPWTTALQAPLAYGIFQARTLQWATISYSRGPFDPGIESTSPVASALSGGFFPTKPTGKFLTSYIICKYKDYIIFGNTFIEMIAMVTF